MIYKAIGLMSGSSLDGLDIAFVRFEEIGGKWSYEILQADCVPYAEEWIEKLRNANQVSATEYIRLHTEYGRLLGNAVQDFINKHEIDHQVQLIGSHGHTILHEPENNTSCQIGDGASIAAITGLPVVSDLRNLDVALGGQGAPIVPIGDQLLYGAYDYLLNIGGIANITVPNGDKSLAFDVCTANQALNALAQTIGKDYDEGGELARSGEVIPELLAELKKEDYYQQAAPKSLSNDLAKDLVLPQLLNSGMEAKDLLRTMVQLIADQVAAAINKYPADKDNALLLVTGGGAHNSFLVEQIQAQLTNVTLQVPDANTVNYKEAVVMALIGVLRWREETNVLSSVTGASKDSISGALWMGHSYS